MTKRTRIPDGDDAAMRLHDMSVSGHPKTEAVARLLKATSDPSFEWLEAESNRRTDPIIVLQAMIEAHVAVAHVVGSAASTKGDQMVLRMLGDAYRAAFVSFADHIEKDAKQQKVRQK